MSAHASMNYILPGEDVLLDKVMGWWILEMPWASSALKLNLLCRIE